MIKQIAWNTFKNTGNINTMIELIKAEETIIHIPDKNLRNNIAIEKAANCTAEENTSNGSNKDKRNSFSSTQYER